MFMDGGKIVEEKRTAFFSNPKNPRLRGVSVQGIVSNGVSDAVILKQLNEGLCRCAKSRFHGRTGVSAGVRRRGRPCVSRADTGRRKRPLPPDDCSRRTAKHISSAELPCCLPIGGSIWENTLSPHWNSRRRHAVPSALPFRHNAVRQAFMKSWAIPKQKSITWTSFVPM